MTLRFYIVDNGQYWHWALVRQRGRGKRQDAIVVGTGADREQCVASIERFRKAVVDAKIVKVKPS